jgi:hypothetical protein
MSSASPSSSPDASPAGGTALAKRRETEGRHRASRRASPVDYSAALPPPRAAVAAAPTPPDELDGLCGMFANLLSAGLVSRDDLVTGGFTEVASVIMTGGHQPPRDADAEAEAVSCDRRQPRRQSAVLMHDDDEDDDGGASRTSSSFKRTRN